MLLATKAHLQGLTLFQFYQVLKIALLLHCQVLVSWVHLLIWDLVQGKTTNSLILLFIYEIICTLQNLFDAMPSVWLSGPNILRIYFTGPLIHLIMHLASQFNSQAPCKTRVHLEYQIFHQQVLLQLEVCSWVIVEVRL